MEKVKGKTGPAPIDLTGQRFERLTALTYTGANGMWLCRCDCGKEKTVSGVELRRGRTRSCGCLHREIAKTGDCRRVHGMSSSPEYRSWSAMLTRCTDSTRKEFKNYGGRGITVCEEWKSFEVFFADMGKRPPKTTLDRIDVDGNYEPGNCRWATNKEQAENRRCSVLMTANGKTATQEEWARELGTSASVLRYRRSIGMTDEQAINVEIRKHTRW